MKAENIMLTLAVGQINIGHTSNLFLTGSRPDKYRSTFSFSSESRFSKYISIFYQVSRQNKYRSTLLTFSDSRSNKCHYYYLLLIVGQINIGEHY